MSDKTISAGSPTDQAIAAQIIKDADELSERVGVGGIDPETQQYLREAIASALSEARQSRSAIPDPVPGDTGSTAHVVFTRADGGEPDPPAIRSEAATPACTWFRHFWPELWDSGDTCDCGAHALTRLPDGRLEVLDVD